MVKDSEIQALFRKMENAGWNMKKPYLWGYFFKDSSREKLEKLKQHLVSLGYEFVDMNQSEADQLFWLHVEKVQQHSLESLINLNKSLRQLAKDFGIAEYDGMDISPIEVL